ncbi:hypothetical protein J4436_00090 [Candidatus Woesearchaeota archaeon]|nr:hypothetical protein [Candidatus Woesearchaeota archaeon]
MKNQDIKKEALSQMNSLFKETNNNTEKRYLELIQKISKKTNTHIPKEIKRKFCKHCLTIYTSTNSTRRIKNNKIIITCKKCNSIKRIITKK